MPTEAEYEAMIREADGLYDIGKTEEAKATLSRCLAVAEEAGDEAFVHCFRGALAVLANDFDVYIAEQSRALEYRPDSPLLNEEFGVALFNSGRYQEALEHLDRALALKPDYVPAMYSRAVVLCSLSRPHEALEAIETATVLSPENLFVLRCRAEVLRNLERREEALETAEKAESIQPNSKSTLSVIAMILTRMRRHNEALARLDRAAALCPDDLGISVGRGVVFRNMGRFDDALNAFEASLKIKPRDRWARTGRALALGNLGRREEAVAELESIVREYPDDETAKRWLFRFEEPTRALSLEREHEKQRRRQERDARDREIKLDAWRKLSGRTAHRIGNQVFAARGALRSIKGEAIPELSEAVLDIEAGLDRMARICSEFRRFSTEQPPKIQSTDVRLLIDDAVRRYSKSAEGIQVQAELAALLPECRWDPQQIDQAIGELLENAIRHAPQGSTITTKVEPCEKSGKDWIRILIRNEGNGIDARYKDRLFEPFFSLRPGGTGLGLAIVSQIIKNHGGTIRETGEPGRFARFEVELPANVGKED